MKKVFKSEKELLEGIIRAEGDCLSADWCLMCPFMDDCVGKAITDAKILPKEERLRKAYDKVFDELMEKELEDDKEED